MKKIISLVSRKIVLAIILIISLAGIVGGFLFYNNYQKQKNTTGAEAEIGSLTKSVGNLIELPSGEVPTVATVSDITKLKNQPFFANAKNGDKVLIYTNSKKAIIYRPSANKIIEVSTINLNNSDLGASNTSPTPTKTSTVKIVLYNGTTIAGFTKKIEVDLKAKFENIEVVGRENASKSDYVKTVVVDINKNPDIASSLAKELNGEVGILPSGETKPIEVDILIILGNSSE